MWRIASTLVLVRENGAFQSNSSSVSTITNSCGDASAQICTRSSPFWFNPRPIARMIATAITYIRQPDGERRATTRWPHGIARTIDGPTRVAIATGSFFHTSIAS